MNTPRSKPALFLLVASLLSMALLGAGCGSKYKKGDGGSGSDGTYTEANLRPPAEQRLQAFIAALDRGDATAARALLSSQQRDPDFLSMMTPEQMRTVADWYRTYRFGAIWGDRVEFRPSRTMPEQANSLYVHFAPGEEGITY